MFGLPAIEWTLDDVKVIQSLLSQCAQAARRAKRTESQKAFNTARAFVFGNLRNYIRQTARADAKLDKSIDALLELPDSPQLLQTLAILRNLKAGDKNALRTSQREISEIGAAEAKAARRIVIAAHQMTPEGFAASIRPLLDERHRKLRIFYIEQAEDRIVQHPSGPPGLAFIDASLAEVRDKFSFGLAPEDYTELEEVAQVKRLALRQEILNEAKANIDSLAVSRASIGEAAAIADRTSPSLDADAKKALDSYAEARQHALAGNILSSARAALADFPATLAGIEELNRHVANTVDIIIGYLDDGQIDGFRSEANERCSANAQEALLEFEALISSFSNDSAGLKRRRGKDRSVGSARSRYTRRVSARSEKTANRAGDRHHRRSRGTREETPADGGHSDQGAHRCHDAALQIDR